MKLQQILIGAALCGRIAAQDANLSSAPQGAPLRLVPSERLVELKFPTTLQTPKAPGERVFDSTLKLKPSGDPIYLVEETIGESEKDKWRTYQRPKVDRFSKDGEGAAIHGYDPVSYFGDRAEKGSKDFAFEYEGLNWYFASALHRDQFQREPQRFLPEYGGFCAYSVGRGYPATADPAAFAIVDHKLYLFFDKAVKLVWEQDQERLVSASDRAWPKLHR